LNGGKTNRKRIIFSGNSMSSENPYNQQPTIGDVRREALKFGTFGSVVGLGICAIAGALALSPAVALGLPAAIFAVACGVTGTALIPELLTQVTPEGFQKNTLYPWLRSFNKHVDAIGEVFRNRFGPRAGLPDRIIDRPVEEKGEARAETVVFEEALGRRTDDQKQKPAQAVRDALGRLGREESRGVMYRTIALIE
jgi:hypothetical protein